MKFVKMHGLGNDFVIMQANNWNEADRFQPMAAFVCDRHIGVGADGLVVMGPHKDQDIFMRIFNPDGSEPEMCGNAIRCVTRYAYEQGIVQQSSISVRTLAGIRYPSVILADNQVKAIKVDMGEPYLTREQIPMAGPGSNQDSITIDNKDLGLTAVSMGNPHCIIFVDDVDKVPVGQWGPVIENHSLFPARTNVEFVQVIGPREVSMRVWERGAGITLACGTGACATLVAAVLNNKTDRQAIVHLLGGDLFIEWDAGNNHVYMTGEAVHVFEGIIDLNLVYS